MFLSSYHLRSWYPLHLVIKLIEENNIVEKDINVIRLMASVQQHEVENMKSSQNMKSKGFIVVIQRN